MTNEDDFRALVYAVVARIPEGKVTTYGLIAEAIGQPRAAREVGRALAVLPDDSGIPAHRVIGRDGKLVGGWAFGGENVQRAMLEAEGVGFLPDCRVDMAHHLYDPIDRPQLRLFGED